MTQAQTFPCTLYPLPPELTRGHTHICQRETGPFSPLIPACFRSFSPLQCGNFITHSQGIKTLLLFLPFFLALRQMLLFLLSFPNTWALQLNKKTSGHKSLLYFACLFSNFKPLILLHKRNPI